MNVICKIGNVDIYQKFAELKMKQLVYGIESVKPKSLAYDVILHKVPLTKLTESVVKFLLDSCSTLVSLPNGEVALAVNLTVSISHPLGKEKDFESIETALY